MDVITQLQNKDHAIAYMLYKEICTKSAKSDEYYGMLEAFLDLVDSPVSYVRTRGFGLVCAQARWDDQGKIEKSMERMLVLLHDKKPAVVRQCLTALHEVGLFRPELCKRISFELNQIKLEDYKETMRPLIQEDINNLKKLVESINYVKNTCIMR